MLLEERLNEQLGRNPFLSRAGFDISEMLERLIFEESQSLFK